MGQDYKGGMWCPRCSKPTLGVKNKHGIRNAGSFLAAPVTMGWSLAATKIEHFVCPDCGGELQQTKGGKRLVSGSSFSPNRTIWNPEMASGCYTSVVEFDFPTDVVFRALTEAVPAIKGFRILDQNTTARPRYLTVATSPQIGQLGERASVSIIDVGPSTSGLSVSASSYTALGRPRTRTSSKNRKDVEVLIRATSDVLKRNGGRSRPDC